MHFDDADSDLLKKWVVKKLEDVSDADSDVLADYVLALIKTDEPSTTARAHCVDNLRDFLLDNTQKFVDDVFTAIATKAYDPSRPVSQDFSTVHTAKQPSEARKRSYNERERDENHYGSIPSFADSDRPMKQPRRGGRGGTEHRGGRYSHPSPQQQTSLNSFRPQDQMPIPHMPAPTPGIDPNNPLAAFFAMQQAMGFMPGMPGFPGAGATQTQNGSSTAQRCRDYDTMGFCARGASCPYEHGNDPYVVPQIEYEPNQATLLNVQPSRTGFMKNPHHERARGGTRGRGRGGPHGRGGRRSDLSHHGPNHDRSVRQVVVEQIPENHLKENSVREFFGEFGSIEEVTMQTEKRLAIVKFEDYDSAKAAYESPKVIFDNRFVKVYWYRPDGVPKHSNGHNGTQRHRHEGADEDMQDQEPAIDPEEIARKQEEAQRKHEEQQKMREAAEKQRQELELKIKATEAQRRQMMEKLSHKTGVPSSGSNETPQSEAPAAEGGQTKDLREQLAKLEAEAKSLGLDPDTPSNGWNGSGFPGRGGFRGRARGRGFQSGLRGSWVAGGARGGGAVKRLDNRPKTVAVTFQRGDYNEHQEALRQFLLFNNAAGDSASLNQHPGRTDTALVAFPQRYQGEMFMTAASASDSPFAGKCELSWYKPEQLAPAPGKDTIMATGGEAGEAATNDGEDRQTREGDAYDVADDDDRWG